MCYEMNDLGTKTPVSRLQEHLKMSPQYKLIHDGTGSHNPVFIFRVQVGSFWEEGKGRSKQDAKHKAAEKMLKTLKVIDEKPEEEASESVMQTAENYVGQLKELCISLHYPEPKYFLEEAAGPGHSRVFKMVCCVSKLQDFGVSRTKKQAKHEAAFKMLQRLKEVLGKKTEIATANLVNQNKSRMITDEEVAEKYYTLKSTAAPVTKDPAVFYKDHHRAYYHLHETSLTLTEILNGSSKISVDNSVALIQQIAKELDMTLKVIKVPSREKDADYTVMSMSVFPPIAAVGVNEKLAAFNLIDSLLVLCKE